MKNLAVFASGTGSNAEKIIEYFNNNLSKNIKVALVVCNNPNAGVLTVAAKFNIPALVIFKENFFNGDAYVSELQQAKIDIIILAGFLWKLPLKLLKAYPGRIINIHPALLPKYGGKGMYGNRVHEAVLKEKEKQSGITIHLVDEIYDHGKPIFQIACPVFLNDTPATLAMRIHELEHTYYAKVIEEFAEKM